MADSNMTIGLSANIDVSNVLAGVKQIQNALSGLKMDPKLTADLTKEFSNLQSYLRDYQKILSKDNISKGDLKTLQKLEDSINSAFTKVVNLQNEINGKPIYLKADSTQLDSLIEKTKEAKKALDDAFNKVNVGNSTGGISQIEGAIEKAVGRSKTLKQSFEDAFKDLGKGNLDQFNNKIDNIFQGLSGKVLKGKLIPTIDSLIGSFQKLGLIDVKINTDTAGEKLVALKTGIQNLKDGIANGLNGEELKGLVSNLEAATKAEKEFEAEAAKRGQDRLSPQIAKTQQLAAATRDGAKAEREFQQATMSAVDQVKQLQQSTQYFFSLRNMINLLKRGVRQAFNTVKELDAAMTETAVVTKFDVGDMWEKLPEYTANANALGATVQDMYKSTTLYYQQGLNASQAMSIATETMKMARIGGLEAAEATDMMTAALRGFNMELNETSAQRINDVYSNLAAKTASNTEELGTAMQRTASIAASAGMSFEGTAAFLAQAIETTREPAENLGTAMKTIVARFQELKKNPLEMVEVDGEEVSYNKVDTALQSIGVSLKDTNGQFRDLDDVFLDISQRWNSLSQVQQRYIATTAAGSRQQSRFIAMMSNYERTMQLMDYANNSAGASNEQFGKTMESLEAKLNKLKNAYQQFTMGIANNTFIKGAVDGLTWLFNTTNKLINLLSGGNSVVKSFLSLFTAFTALKTGGRIINSLIGGLGGMVDPTSTFRAGFKGGAIGRNSAQAVNQPIVRELQSIRQLIAQKIVGSGSNKLTALGPYEELNRFKAARSAIIDMNGKGTVGDLTKQLSGLSKANQNLLMRSNAGTFAAATRSILTNYYNDPKFKNEGSIRRGERFLNDQRKSGEITATEYYKALQDPGLLKRAMVAAGVNENNAAYKYIDSLDKSITQKAMDLGQDQFEKAVADARKNGIKINEENYKRAQESYRNKALEGEGATKYQVSKGGLFLDRIGQFGSKISQAGMGLQTFGSILASSANPAISMFGSLLTSVGGMISGLGMGISGITNAFTAVSESTMMTKAFGSAAGAATSGLFALAGVLMLIVALIKKQRQQIRDDAEKLTETYKDKSQKNQTNIVNLTQWKEEFPRLAEGVDANGLNVNLDPGDYQHYLEIVDAIAEMNPAIVKGYNAQGHAIIDNNTALEDTLALQQELGEQLAKNYTSTEAWNKLLDARNLEAHLYGTGKDLKSKHIMREKASTIGTRLISAQQEGLVDLSGIDIDLSLLAAGNRAETEKFIQQYNQIKQRVTTAIENAGDEWSEANSKTILKAFSAYDEASGELEELIQPLYESMSIYASGKKAYENLDERFKPYFQNMLKQIAEDADIDTDAEMREAIDNTLEEVEEISPVITEALEEIEYAREEFISNLNEEDYDALIEKPLEALEQLRDKYEEEGNDTFVQWIENIMARAKDRTIESTQTITSALNTLSSEIAAAEGAVSDFEEKTKSDFSTAAEGMKSIFDKAMEKDDKGNYTHRGYNGDNTYWTAAGELLGDISGKTKQQVDKMMDNLEPMLRDGPEGFANFALKVRSLKDEIKDIEGVDWSDSENFIEKIDDSANPEVWTQLANAMGMSEQVLISLLNKGKQFADIDFSDNKALKTALLSDPNTVTGANGTLIMTSEQLRDAMGAEEYYRTGKSKRRELRKEENIYVAEEAAKFKRKNARNLARNLGIDLGKSDQGTVTRELIDKIGGLYSKDDLQKIAQKTYEEQLGLKTGEQLTDTQKENFVKDFNAAYKEWQQAEENELLAPVQSIESCVKTLADKADTEKIESGGLTADMMQGDRIKKAIYGKNGKDGDEPDSLVEYFKKGLDAQGEKLTETTFQQSKNELVSLRNSLEERKASLEKGMALAKEKNLDTSMYEQELKDVNEGITELDGVLGDFADSIFQKIKEAQEGGEEGEEPSKADKYDDRGTKDEETKTEPPKSSNENANDGLAGKDYKNAEDKNFWQFLSEAWKQSQIEKAAREEQNQDAQGKTREELHSEASEFWSNLTSGVNDTLNEQKNSISQDTSATDTSTSDAADNLNAGSESLAEAANQFITSINTLSTAADSLNTAGQNLTNAAATLVTNNNSGSTTPAQSTPGMPSNVPPNQQSSASGIVVVDNSPAKASLEELNALALDVKGTIEEGATFKVDVTGANKLTKAATAAESLINKNGKGASIAVSTGAVDKDSVKKSIADINKSKATILIGANGKAAEQTARNLIDKINSYRATVDIYANFAGSWEKTYTITKKSNNNDSKDEATGTHNHGYVAPPPKAGSAARGSYGQLGPKGKGGLTLTGELGYEIAWLPSENRSMILGANGPQMVNLPGDAVVWTHEQSKRIMKQKSIPAGSHAGSLAEGTATIHGIDAFLNAYHASSVGSGTINTVKNTGKAVRKAAEDTAKQIGYVSVWWENIARQTDATQRKMDNNAKMFEKYLKEMRSTLKRTGESLASGGGGGDAYIKTISDSVGLNQVQLDRVNSELKTLDKGTKAQRKAEKTKSKEDNKKANKSAFNKGKASAVQVSYEKGSGKKKKTANEIINTSKYVVYDATTDTYLVDQKQLNKIKNKSKRKAVKEAVNKEIDDRVSKRNKAQDNIQKANEALEKMGEELYNTFFKWENELTKIWNITQQIEATEARISRAKNYSDLLQSQLSTGMAQAGGLFSEQTLEAFRAGLTSQQKKIQQTFSSLNEKKTDLNKLLSLDDEKAMLTSIQNKLAEDIKGDINIQNAIDKQNQKQKVYNDKSKKLTDEENNNKKLKDERKDLKQKLKNTKNKKQRAKIQKQINALDKKIATSDKNIKNYKADKQTAEQALNNAKDNTQKIKKQYKGTALNNTQKLGYEAEAEKLEEKINAQAEAWKYLRVNQLADGTIDLQFNTDAFEAEKEKGNISEELGKSIQDYVKDIVETSKNLDEEYSNVITSMNDMYGTLQTLQGQWVEYANELWQISDEQAKKEIDNAKKLNDSLTKTIKNLLDDVKKKLDQRRKQEDNAKTEREISQKQQRLAALRADTSGGHAVEIAQLEKEISDSQQDYQRTLEDQLLDNLQQQADIASEQRERQIALQEAMVEATNNAAEVNKWMNDPAAYRNEIFEAYKEANDFNKKPEALQDELIRKFEEMYDGLLNNQIEQEEAKAAINSLQNEATYLETIKNTLETLAANPITIEVIGGTGVAEGGTSAFEDKIASQETLKIAKEDYNKKLTSIAKDKKLTSKEFSAIRDLAKEAKVGGAKTYLKDLAKKVGWEQVIKAAKDANFSKYRMALTFGDDKDFKTAFNKVYGKGEFKKVLETAKKKKYTPYATGGLADYTGPAWLDGTPSRPELVLNAQDTKNFIALKDILSKVVRMADSSEGQYGNATYEININVDKIANDYDVDKMAERVKKIIVKDSSYRNVTQVRKFR